MEDRPDLLYISLVITRSLYQAKKETWKDDTNHYRSVRAGTHYNHLDITTTEFPHSDETPTNSQVRTFSEIINFDC